MPGPWFVHPQQPHLHARLYRSGMPAALVQPNPAPSDADHYDPWVWYVYAGGSPVPVAHGTDASRADAQDEADAALAVVGQS